MSRLRRAGAALLLAACGAAPTPAQQHAGPVLDAAGDAMRTGIAAAGRGDLPAAQQAFTRAVGLAPHVSTTHAALGSVLLAQNDLTAAAQELERAHALAPQDAAVDLNLARALTGLGRAPEALALFRAAVAAQPPPALSEDETLAYAAALAATGDQPTAESVLRAATTSGASSARLLDALGSVQAQQGRLDDARASFEQALLLSPRMPEANYHLGTVLLLGGQAEPALAPLRLATTAEPKNFAYALQLGRALAAAHQDSGALRELDRAIPLAPRTLPPEQAGELADALEAAGAAQKSLPYFAAALSGPAPGSGTYINAALARVQTGDAAGALPLYAKALALGPDTPTLREDYGVAYLQQADLTHAIEQFRAGLTQDPASASLHYDLGLAYKLKDDLVQSIPELERAAALDPSLPDPAYTLGILYMQQGRDADAAAQLRRTVELQPENQQAWALLGSVLRDSDPAAAVQALERAIALDATQPSLHIQLAALYAKAGDTARAASERKTAAELSRVAMDHQRATFALRSGKTLLAEGRLPEAVTQLTIATQAEPSMTEAHLLLAEALTRQGRSAEAAVEREHAAAHDHP